MHSFVNLELPADCPTGVARAASTCLGTPPRYFPIWGCVGLGALAGFCLGFLVACIAVNDFGRVRREARGRIHQEYAEAEVARPRHLPPAPGLHVMPPWHSAAQRALRLATDANRRTVLQRLIIDGDGALQLLAASAGTSRRVVLALVLGEAVVQENAEFWAIA